MIAGNDSANLMRAAWRQRWLIVMSIAIGIGSGIVYLQRAAPTFASVGRLYVQRSIPRIANDPASSLPESTNYLYTQCEIIKSTGVIADVARLPAILQLPTLAGEKNLVSTLQLHLKAEVDGRNDLISVLYESPNAADAAIIVNAIVDQYISFSTRQHHNSAAEVLRILQKEKSTRDEQLTSQLQKMKQFKQANPALSFTSADRRGNLAVETLSRLTDALTAAKLATIDATSAYEAVLQRSKMNLPVGSVVADPLLRDELIRLEERREISRAKMGESSQEIQSVDGSIARLQERMATQDKAANEAAVASAKQSRDAVAAKQKEIEEQVAAQEKKAIAVNSAEAEYAALDAELQRTQKISDVIDARIKELNVTEDAPPTMVTILESARPNPKPVAPDKSRALAAGLLLGLLLGFMLAWIRNVLTQHVGLTSEEVAAALGIPVLGAVPRVRAKNLATCGRAVELNSRGGVAEAYRSLRTRILLGSDSSDFKTLLVTSPCAADGKTTAAANLAIAIAQSGQRTLLIDADLRRPSLGKIFDDTIKLGVTDVISRRAKLRDVLQATSVHKLSVLHAGTPSVGPSEVLTGNSFAQMLAALSSKYDKIVIDSPPLGFFADGEVLAANTEMTVLVVRAGRSSRKVSQAAAQSLETVGAKVAGVILNAHQMPSKALGYYSYGPAEFAPPSDGAPVLSVAHPAGSSY